LVHIAINHAERRTEKYPIDSLLTEPHNSTRCIKIPADRMTEEFLYLGVCRKIQLSPWKFVDGFSQA
jgi:hypothetical protein